MSRWAYDARQSGGGLAGRVGAAQCSRGEAEEIRKGRAWYKASLLASLKIVIENSKEGSVKAL